MIQEEILFKSSKTGTTAFYFVPDVTSDLVPYLQEPAYLVFNSFNIPVAFYNFNSGSTEIWNLENVSGYNLNVLVSPLPPISIMSPLSAASPSITTYVSQANPNAINYITGYSITETFNKILSSSEKTTIQQRFNDNITNTITAQTQVPINYQTYVFFNEHEIDDMFANIKLSRSYETLDTLQIYNKPINTITSQEAKTGVVFGKLEAIQVLKDSSGNNVRIPLKNVPIGIFNVSDEFPSPVSTDTNGDRFFMNLKESSSLTGNSYFDSIAFNEDQKFLKTETQDVTVPDKFKYVTITNDNGEFVIYNAPIGSQTIIFEVDLFKQGLTKDEIILNNFPFPTDDQANIGELPCYFFKQIPIDVVPAWGTVQTGYTEVNISANLDLRKWTTYIFPPAAYGNEKLETTVAKNITSTLKIQIRDMTVNKFATKILNTTQIPNDLDRRDGSKYLWFNEILSQRQQLEFFKFGCHVLKLPANLYDPNGYRTDSGGTPTNQRGLWLSSYQFRVFVNKTRSLRDTGGYKDPGTGNFWSHFDVNFISGATNIGDFSGLGVFPYERPWSLTYPEPYKIPTKPVFQRFTTGTQRALQTPYILEEPAYEDGDLVGNEVFSALGEEVAGGFGVQSTNGVSFPNEIAYVATKDFMYKYEKGVSPTETYANGYTPSIAYPGYPTLSGMSSVNNGEKYQRLECGYGYFMKYRDWPRVFREDINGSDIYFPNDVGSAPGITAAGNYLGNFKSLTNWRHQTYNIDDQNVAFAFDQFVNNKTSQDGIEIYRIVNSGIDNIRIPENFLIPTSVNLHLGGYQTRLYSMYLINAGTADALLYNSFQPGTVLQVNNPSGGTVSVYQGQYFTLNPSGIYYVGGTSNSFPGNAVAQAATFVGISLPGNDQFDTSLNKYKNANYILGVSLTTPYDPGGHIPNSTGHVDIGFNVSSNVIPADFYLNSEIVGGNRTGASDFGLTAGGNFWNIHIDTSPYSTT